MSETNLHHKERRADGTALSVRGTAVALRAAAEGRQRSPAPSQPLEVHSQRLREAKIQQRLAYLRSISDLRTTGRVGQHTWQNLLSGSNLAVSDGGVHPNTKACIKAAGASLVSGVRSFGGMVDSGADYAALAAAWPTRRYKFYHSLDDMKGATSYLIEVIKRANEQGLSLNLKSFDHAYDSANIYTYHFREMQTIIADVYADHAPAFGSTEHFLQGTIPGVRADHIGWVQEPILGYARYTHSERMGQLGAVLDREGLSQAAYEAGCAHAGVQPDQPWLLSPDYEQRIIQQSTRPASHR